MLIVILIVNLALDIINVINVNQDILGILKLFNVNQFVLLANIGILKMLHVKIVYLIVLRNLQ